MLGTDNAVSHEAHFFPTMEIASCELWHFTVTSGSLLAVKGRVSVMAWV